MEKTLYRIILGYTPYNPGVHLKIRTPNMEVRFKSCVIHDKILERAKNHNLLSEKEIYTLMSNNGIWTQDDEENFSHLPKQIEEFKLQLFRNIHSNSNQQRLRPFLKVAQSTYEKLLVKRHMYDYISVDGLANFAKWQYIISKSTYKGKKIWNWSKGNPYEALNIYYKNIIPEAEIRNISKSPFWDAMYHSKREIFGKPTVELTHDQQRLLSWSHMYEAAYEQNDFPPKLLIDDDDVFDGWLIYNSRKRNKIDPDKLITNQKIANSDEIFLPAKNRTDIALVKSMNSDKSNQVIKDRVEKMKKDGEVFHRNFKDVQMKRFEK